VGGVIMTIILALLIISNEGHFALEDNRYRGRTDFSIVTYEKLDSSFAIER
jgi:hypothetical protein